MGNLVTLRRVPAYQKVAVGLVYPEAEHEQPATAKFACLSCEVEMEFGLEGFWVCPECRYELDMAPAVEIVQNIQQALANLVGQNAEVPAKGLWAWVKRICIQIYRVVV
jgi:ribosomal protein L37AE/L43A